MLKNGDSFTGQIIKVFILLFLVGQALDVFMAFALVHSYSGSYEEIAVFGFVSTVIWVLQFSAHLTLLVPLGSLQAQGALNLAKLKASTLVVPSALLGALGCVLLLAGPRPLHADTLSYVELLGVDLLGLLALLLCIRVVAGKKGLEETGQAALSTLGLFTLACVLTVGGGTLSLYLSLLGVALVFLSVLRAVRVVEMFADPLARDRGSSLAGEPSL